MTDRRACLDAIRAALAKLSTGAAWDAGKTPNPDEIFAPSRHRNVLDISRSLVVGNRGVGKTFWSHALTSASARQSLSDVYRLPVLRDIDARFGYRGTFADELAPSTAVLAEAVAHADPLVVWQAILLRALGGAANSGLPEKLKDLTKWFAANAEEGEKRIRACDEERTKSNRPFVLLFDALDTLGNDWEEIRARTVGILRLSLLAKGLSSVNVKVFMRPDQFADTSLFRFPDASKLRAERVNLQWNFIDLYGLLFFNILRQPDARGALGKLIGTQYVGSEEPYRSSLFNSPYAQRSAFDIIAGPWMGADRKRGAVYSWLVQHLADARDETTPRGFLTAVRAAATSHPKPVETAIDYRGIQHGVSEASENRVDDLQQDYWWIDYSREPLAGLETPIEKERLLQVWREDRTAAKILIAAETRGVPPIYLSLRGRPGLPPELERLVATAEDALLSSLQLIGVAETRANGKVNFPDIFRVAFKMKRRGGVPPRRIMLDTD